MDEKIAVEKLNNSELVNQYVNVVETLLEEKKELSQRTERLTSQMKEAEDIIRAQNEVNTITLCAWWNNCFFFGKKRR